jgi:hypothetical protein
MAHITTDSIININTIASIFLVFLTANYIRHDKGRMNDVYIFILFALAFIMGLAGYGDKIVHFGNNNRKMYTSMAIFMTIIVYSTFLSEEDPDSCYNVILLTVILTVLIHRIYFI